MSRRPILLDLFCGAGGCSVGYHRAGFDVVGVDIKMQKRYPFEFHQGDALTFPLDGFDAIHASPPCQAHTTMKTMYSAKEHPDLIPATRDRLQAAGVPYVMENVEGAPLVSPILLCGTMFDLGCEDAELRRHRLFECSFPVLVPHCRHRQRNVIGVYGGHLRNRRRRAGSEDRGVEDFDVTHGRVAMGIDWMTLAELCQAVPPSFTEFIGRELLATL